MFNNLTAFALVLTMLGFTQPRALGAQADVSVRATDVGSNLFGGHDARLPFVVTANRQLEGIAAWTLSVDQRIVARGKTAVAATPQTPGNIEIRVDMPKVKAGVVLRAVLSFAIYGQDRHTAEASLEKPLWIFSEDPFTDRSRWLKELKICLFDPSGNTRQVFEKMKIPFSQTANVDSLDALDRGLLIIGEGTSFRDYRGLPELMMKTAAGGTAVLCLAPLDGEIMLPGSLGVTTEFPLPERLLLRRNDVICELDKRLDALVWGTGVRPLASALSVRSDRNRVVGEVVQSPDGWPWLEIGFPAEHGKLIVCGFGVVRHWQIGPTPRFLFARILEYLTLTQKPPSSLSKGEQ